MTDNQGRHSREYSYPTEQPDLIFKWGSNALIQSELEEGNAYEEVFKDAPEPKLDLELADGKKLELRRDNTLIMEYPHYPEFDHITHQGDGQRYILWRNMLHDVFDRAKNAGFDTVSAVVPTESDYMTWVESQIKRLLK